MKHPNKGEVVIRPLSTRAQIGGQSRFRIKGMRGIFGAEKAREIWESRTDKEFPV